MIDPEINKMIIDKIKEADTPQYIKDFILEILRHERSVYDQYEAGGTPRYSQVYENLLNRYVREYKKVQGDEAD